MCTLLSETKARLALSFASSDPLYVASLFQTGWNPSQWDDIVLMMYSFDSGDMHLINFQGNWIDLLELFNIIMQLL